MTEIIECRDDCEREIWNKKWIEWNPGRVESIERVSAAIEYANAAVNKNRKQQQDNPLGLPWRVGLGGDCICDRNGAHVKMSDVLARCNAPEPTHPDNPRGLPWENGITATGRPIICRKGFTVVAEFYKKDDRDYALARCNAPDQSDEIAKLKAENARYREALEKYADRDNWGDVGELRKSVWNANDPFVGPHHAQRALDNDPPNTHQAAEIEKLRDDLLDAQKAIEDQRGAWDLDKEKMEAEIERLKAELATERQQCDERVNSLMGACSTLRIQIGDEKAAHSRLDSKRLADIAALRDHADELANEAGRLISAGDVSGELPKNVWIPCSNFLRNCLARHAEMRKGWSK